jgi:hypothetical protein
LLLKARKPENQSGPAGAEMVCSMKALGFRVAFCDRRRHSQRLHALACREAVVCTVARLG